MKIIFLLTFIALVLLSCTNSLDPQVTLSPPGELTIFQSAITQFKLNWIDNSIDENGYMVQRKFDDDVWKEIAALPENTEFYTDDISTSRQTSNHIAYRICSFAGNHNSDFSEVNTNIVFPAPTDLEFCMIDWWIRWTDNSLGEEGFAIERSVNGSEFELVWINEPNLNGNMISGIEEYTDYAYRVYAFVGDFHSDYSNLIQFTTDFSHFAADFVGDPLTVGNVTSVQFTDISMIHYAPIIAWEWDFGNGQTSDQKNPDVLYLGSGAYTVSLTVTDTGNRQDTKTKIDYIVIE
jgi:PKD repeat protein